MDFLNLVVTGRRHWVLMSLGVALGLIVAVGSLYHLDRSADTPRLRPRSFTQYKMEMQLIVIDPFFGLGRAGVNIDQPDLFMKTVILSATYAKLLTSDAVRASAERTAGPADAEITSDAVDGSPIVLLTLSGRDADHMEAYGRALAKSLQDYLQEQQEEQDISSRERMSVRLLAVSEPIAEKSRRLETALLAFMGPVAFALGVAVLRDKA